MSVFFFFFLNYLAKIVELQNNIAKWEQPHACGLKISCLVAYAGIHCEYFLFGIILSIPVLF